MNKFFQKRGFNLVELLVVISITMILTAIIIPKMNIAKKKVKDKSIRTELASLEATASVFYAENDGAFDDNDGVEDGICQTEYFKETLKQIEINLGDSGTVSCVDTEQNWYVVADLLLGTNEKACVGAGASLTAGEGITGSNCSTVHQQAGVSGSSNIPPATQLNPQSVHISTGDTQTFTFANLADRWTFKCKEGATELTGTTPPSPSLTCTYPDAGSFTAVLTSTDDATGLSGIDTTVVVVTQGNQSPVAVLTPASVTVDTGADLILDGSGSSDPDAPGDSITSWSLDCGNGVTRQGAGAPPNNINCNYSSAGSYTATLTVTDSNSASDTDTSSIDVNTPPTISISPTSLTTTINTNQTFHVTMADADGNDTLSHWNYKCNTSDSWSANQTISSTSFVCSWSTTGTKTVMVRVVDDKNSIGNATATVTINNQAPSIGISPKPVTVNTNVQQTFTVTPTDPDGNNMISHWNYKCKDSDSWSTNQTLPVNTFNCTWTTNGTYTVSVQVEDNGGATGNNTSNVTVNTNQPLTFTIPDSASGSNYSERYPGPLTNVSGPSLNITNVADPDGDWHNVDCTIDWGDGHTTTHANKSGGTYGGSNYHTYAKMSGRYFQTVTCVDEGGASVVHTRIQRLHPPVITSCGNSLSPNSLTAGAQMTLSSHPTANGNTLKYVGFGSRYTIYTKLPMTNFPVYTDSKYNRSNENVVMVLRYDGPDGFPNETHCGNGPYSTSGSINNRPPTIKVNSFTSPGFSYVTPNTNRTFNVSKNDADGSVTSWRYKCSLSDSWHNQPAAQNSFTCNWPSEGIYTVHIEAVDNNGTYSSPFSGSDTGIAGFVMYVYNNQQLSFWVDSDENSDGIVINYLSDPDNSNSSINCSISWGDGTTSNNVAKPQYSNSSAATSHFYPRNGSLTTYIRTVTCTDSGGKSVSHTEQIVIP